MSAIRSHFEPLRRPRTWTPRKWMRLGVDLSEIIPTSEVAYLLDVDRKTVQGWRIKDSDGRLLPPVCIDDETETSHAVHGGRETN